MKSNLIYLNDILSCIDKIFVYIGEVSEDDFVNSPGMANDAVLMNLVSIGESCAKIPLEVRAKSQTIPWRKVIDLRNIAVHQYFEVDYQLIWNIVMKELVDLKREVTRLTRDPDLE